MLNRTRFAAWTPAALAALLAGSALAQDGIEVRGPVRTAPQVAAAQQDDGPSGPAILDEAAAAGQAVERALLTRIGGIRFDETPAPDALQLLAENARVDLVVDPKVLADEDLSGHPISLDVSRGKVSVRTALELVLEQIGPDLNLTYTVRDGIVFITYAANAAQVVVYDCRDLLERPTKAAAAAAAAGIPAEMIPAAAAKPTELFQGNVDDLVAVLTATIAPDSWDEGGGFGTVTSYRGLMVIKQSPAVHRQIQELLTSLRTAMHGPASAHEPAESEPRR